MNPNDYISQSPTSNPGKYAHLFDNLPTDLLGISKITQGLVYHYVADQYEFGWRPSKPRIKEINTRTMVKILEKLLKKDGRSLTEPRAHKNKIVGCCRDYSLLACAILRHQGRAARLRYGFANYFYSGWWVDHVIVEVWENGRWLRFDPQYAGREKFKRNLIGMSDALFWTGGKAWQNCQLKVANPKKFGLGPSVKGVSGYWFIRERLQLDIAALNKVELLCWDVMSHLSEKKAADKAILNEMAALSITPDNELFTRCQTDDNWRVPMVITCFNPAVGRSTVTVA